MILDSEDQRKRLLDALANVQLAGTAREVSVFLDELSALARAVKEATVEVPDGGKPE